MILDTGFIVRLNVGKYTWSMRAWGIVVVCRSVIVIDATCKAISQLGMSSSQLTFIFFRGVGLNHQPEFFALEIPQGFFCDLRPLPVRPEIYWTATDQPEAGGCLQQRKGDWSIKKANQTMVYLCRGVLLQQSQSDTFLWYPPQWNSRLGFINQRLTLLKMIEVGFVGDDFSQNMGNSQRWGFWVANSGIQRKAGASSLQDSLGVWRPQLGELQSIHESTIVSLCWWEHNWNQTPYSLYSVYSVQDQTIHCTRGRPLVHQRGLDLKVTLLRPRTNLELCLAVGRENLGRKHEQITGISRAC